MRTLHQEVRFRVGKKLQRLVRKGHRPILAEFRGEFGEHKPIWDAAIVAIVITQRALYIGIVPEVEDRVAAHIGNTLFPRLFRAAAFQSQSWPRLQYGSKSCAI